MPRSDLLPDQMLFRVGKSSQAVSIDCALTSLLDTMLFAKICFN